MKHTNIAALKMTHINMAAVASSHSISNPVITEIRGPSLHSLAATQSHIPSGVYMYMSRHSG